MRRLALATLLGSGVFLLGCVSTQYVGTWRGEAPETAGDFAFGGMTLGPDGGYTAYANYGGGTKGFTGTYEVEPGGEGDMLRLEGSGRSYQLLLEDDLLTVLDPDSGVSTRMYRVDD